MNALFQAGADTEPSTANLWIHPFPHLIPAIWGQKQLPGLVPETSDLGLPLNRLENSNLQADRDIQAECLCLPTCGHLSPRQEHNSIWEEGEAAGT